MTGELKGRHALITGGSGGIGSAVARALHNRGANITLVGRDRARLDGVLGSAAGVERISADVREPKSVAVAFEAARSKHGPVDLLVNAAGDAVSRSFARTTDEDWELMLAANLTCVFLCCREAIGPMIEGRFGRIVSVVSTAGLTGYRYVAAYCAAKHGVVGLTRSLALEAADKGVTVNAVCPGYTETPMLETTVSNIVSKTGRSLESARAALLASTPRGAFVTPAEVASVVTWLCLPGSDAINGQAIAVDGGELAG